MNWNSKMTAQAVGGAALGYLLFLVGGATGVAIHCPRGEVNEAWSKVCIWALVPYVIGVALGVYLVGKLLKQKGSLRLTLLGSIVGGFGVYLALLASQQGALCLLISILPPVFSTLGCHLRATGTAPQHRS